MRKKQERVTPVITVPKGYDLFDLIDVDDKDQMIDKRYGKQISAKNTNGYVE